MGQSIDIDVIQPKDKTEVLQLAQQDHAESVFAEMLFSQQKFDVIFDKILNHKAIGLLARVGQQPVGFVYVTLGEYFVSDARPIATVNALYVKAPVRHSLIGGKVAIQLIQSVKRIAQDHQATHLLFHVTSAINISKTDRFFRKLGAMTLGGNYLFRI